MVRRQNVCFTFTQEHFADKIGVSLVHTNKSLARLKRTGAFEWIGETFTMIDEVLLADLADQPSIAPGPKPFI